LRASAKRAHLGAATAVLVGAEKSDRFRGR
jgi:hypothetical protein